MRKDTLKFQTRGVWWRVLTAVLPLLCVLSTSKPAHAYAWMIRHGYSGCPVCHADPSGGETLTAYGRAQSDLLLRTRWDGKNPEEARSSAARAGRSMPLASACHETDHIWQNRLFGNYYTATYVGWMAFFATVVTVTDLGWAVPEAILHKPLPHIANDVSSFAYFLNPWEANAYCHNPGGWKSYAGPNYFCPSKEP
jgi:hypothetical protein